MNYVVEYMGFPVVLALGFPALFQMRQNSLVVMCLHLRVV